MEIRTNCINVTGELIAIFAKEFFHSLIAFLSIAKNFIFSTLDRFIIYNKVRSIVVGLME